MNIEPTHHFKQYGKQFKEKIFQALLTDRNWSTQMTEIMAPSFFDLKYLEFLTDRYFTYYAKYKDFPTLPLLITIIRDELKEGKDTILRDQIVDFLQRIRVNPDVGDRVRQYHIPRKCWSRRSIACHHHY